MAEVEIDRCEGDRALVANLVEAGVEYLEPGSAPSSRTSSSGSAPLLNRLSSARRQSWRRTLARQTPPRAFAPRTEIFLLSLRLSCADVRGEHLRQLHRLDRTPTCSQHTRAPSCLERWRGSSPIGRSPFFGTSDERRQCRRPLRRRPAVRHILRRACCARVSLGDGANRTRFCSTLEELVRSGLCGWSSKMGSQQCGVFTRRSSTIRGQSSLSDWLSDYSSSAARCQGVSPPHIRRCSHNPSASARVRKAGSCRRSPAGPPVRASPCTSARRSKGPTNRDTERAMQPPRMGSVGDNERADGLRQRYEVLAERVTQAVRRGGGVATGAPGDPCAAAP